MPNNLVNICKAIDCPYFSTDYERSWGCQFPLYPTAHNCHLISPPHTSWGRQELYKHATQYALYADPNKLQVSRHGDPINYLKAENEDHLRGTETYIRDLKLKQEGFLTDTDAPFRLIES